MPSRFLLPRRGALALAALLALPACSDDGGSDDGGDEVPDDRSWCDPVADWDSERVNFENEVLRLVNQRRAAGADCGGRSFEPTGSLTMDPALRCAARRHSLDMVERNFFAHDDPDGVTPWDRAGSAGYDASAIGENIAAGQPTAEAVMDAWMQSPGHCSNIMNPDANEFGVGMMPSEGQADFGVYWTQMFGRR